MQIEFSFCFLPCTHLLIAKLFCKKKHFIYPPRSLKIRAKRWVKKEYMKKYKSRNRQLENTLKKTNHLLVSTRFISSVSKPLVS